MTCRFELTDFFLNIVTLNVFGKKIKNEKKYFIFIVLTKCTPHISANGALLPWGEFHSSLPFIVFKKKYCKSFSFRRLTNPQAVDREVDPISLTALLAFSSSTSSMVDSAITVSS